MAAGRWAYDYYDVWVPDDLGDDDERVAQAFREAEEASASWCVPAVWYVVKAWGEMFRIGRKRFARKGGVS